MVSNLQRSYSNVLTQIDPLPSCSIDDLHKQIGSPWKSSRTLQSGESLQYHLDLVMPANLSKLPSPSCQKILLIDFGEVFFITQPPTKGLGTPLLYVAPEVLFSKVASPVSDVWALGCLLFMLCEGQRLFLSIQDEDDLVCSLWARLWYTS